ncbi:MULTISPECIES: DUF4184 family protein [Streptomyces]|uniref:DUF4184 family protein n=1 Tax=Streptomyces doudnae TaxID=3075536 RepID=A0ABD5ELC6_9ACTN|nr:MULTISPECIES: DUF4184 family protein [unclassified Streptomyces]MDT0435396.1 DUF4184 family protein [Streptomyces sp. DSM 41981]MYQ64736.1 DUF4184 family protein [Streptomyces sp. SID4950]SCD85266.1 protein of unknown function [Streptomyces sp. SolWspMP-5a-2]
MPFTLSHAAAVLPAVRGDGSGRGRLVPAVLVAGSFAPDLTYYADGVVPGAMEFGRVTHSVPGVFTVDVLFCWALVGLWLLLRAPLVALLPGARQARSAALLRCGTAPARPSLPLAARWYASAVLGALTHIGWDAFTHHGRWGTRLVPFLGETVAGAPVYWYVQYVGSALAAVVIGVFVLRALRRVPLPGGPTGVPALSARERAAATALIAGCATVAALFRATAWWSRRGEAARPWELIPTLCFGAGAGLLAGAVLHAAVLHRRREGAGAGTR